MKFIRHPKALILLLFIFLFANISFGQDNNINFGKIKKIYSKVLNEEREIFISLPRNYDNSNKKYPVLYVLDGERNFVFSKAVVQFLAASGRMPNMIIIGIPNTMRNRDFTPSEIEMVKESGGADNFLKFMNDELFGIISDSYRVHDFKILSGHSLCGMFAVYTAFAKPEMFNAYIAISPYVMYKNDYVLTYAENSDKRILSQDRFMFITVGNEPAYFKGLDKFKSLLKKKSGEGFKWKFEKFEDDDHASVPLKSLYNGLETLFHGWRYSKPLAESNMAELEKHYSNLSSKYGFDIKIPEFIVNQLGYQIKGKGNIDEAIEIFKYNVKNYPESANVYDSLGEAYEAKKQYDLALQNYKSACVIGKKNNVPNLAVFMINKKRVEDKLK